MEKHTDNNEDFECHVCQKRFKKRRYLHQHIQLHTRKLECKQCGVSFSFSSSLKRHERLVHGIGKDKTRKPTLHRCLTCHQAFERKDELRQHIDRAHQQTTQSTFSCRHCSNECESYSQLVEHIEQNHPLNQEGGRQEVASQKLYDNDYSAPTKDSTDSSPMTSQDHTHSNESESALNNSIENRYLYPRRNERYDMLTFFANTEDEIKKHIRSRVDQLGGIKWNLCVQVELQKDDGIEATTATPYFRSRTYRLLQSEELEDHDINEAFQKMFAGLEKYQREGSNWFVKTIIKIELHTVVYKPLSGSSYLQLPLSLMKSNSLLNICNSDNKCFLYSILASLHPQQHSPEKPKWYEPYANELQMKGISYPVILSDVLKFEKQNDNISINVFGWDDESIIPLRITEYTNRLHHVNLLWIKNEDTSHYCLIKDLNRFLSRTKTHHNKMYFCPYCLYGFTKEDLLLNHKDTCSIHGPQKVILPLSDAVLKFKEYEKTLKVPFVIYADFETVNVKLHTCMPNPNNSATTPTAKLEVCGFGYKVVCENPRYTKPTIVYRGPDAGKKLIECLLEEQNQINEILSHIEPMGDHDGLIDTAKTCCLCKKEFTLYDRTYKKIVVHHNHVTGTIIGAACNSCNLNCKQAKFTPVIFHNLKNFDAHLLCESLGEFKEYRLSCIPQNSERYISFSLGRLRFLDSFQFLPSSLETLVENLKQDGIDAFPYLLAEFTQDKQVELLTRKGVYPYEYMDSFDRFDEKELPPLEQFYSSIKKEHITEEDYAHAQTIFQAFNMSSLGEYHDLYLKLDTVLLSCVFESFRTVCLNQYELDPCHFYTSPGLSWTSLLKMTKVELELLTDIDQLLMVESGLRGGLSQISNRYKKCNNKYVDGYDVNDVTSYLMYYDANNLYGWAMIQPLPVSDFRFMDELEGFDVLAVPQDAEIGYILEVSLHYPEHLHDLHNCLPLAPERKVIQAEELSPYARQLLRQLHGLKEDDPLPSLGHVEKLLATLSDKDHYVLHYRNLQLYLQLGMELKEIHRVLQFRQKPWMKSYIDFNTDMRKKARSTFEKNFYKLMNVSVFGKTMQNVRKHKNIELVHREERLKKLTAKPTYKHTIIFNEDLTAVELLRSQVKLFQPSYSGMCILELSKCHMYDFWYNQIKKRYGQNALLAMTDTDSLLLSIKTVDIYEDMLSSMEFFDTSDYPQTHVLHSDENKKVLGKFKDEVNGVPISEFIGLRSKMYSFVCGGVEEKRAKGVSKVTVKKDFKHEHYRRCLFEETKRQASMTSLRSHQHELFCETINKTGLSAFDDKRFLLNAIDSYAYGHYKIRDLNQDKHEAGSQRVEEPMEESIISVQGPIEFSDEPSMFDGWTYVPIEDQSFTLEGCRITPLARSNIFQ